MLQVVHDEASGFWTGRPWLVIAEEGTPAVASFKTDGEAFGYVEDEESETTLLKCDRCDATFSSAFELLEHRRVSHQEPA